MWYNYMAWGEGLIGQTVLGNYHISLTDCSVVSSLADVSHDLLLKPGPVYWVQLVHTLVCNFV